MKEYFAPLVLAAALAAQPTLAEPFRLIVSDLETPLVPNSVMDLALANGYFDRAGVEVELVRVQQTPMAMAALQAGEGEMANVSTDALLQLVARGATDLRAVTSPNKALPFLIAAAPGIASPADLAGKSFGVGRVGSLDHSLSMKVLAAAGVATDELEIVSLGQPAVRAQALMAGQVDATTMSVGTLMSLPERDSVNVLIDADAYYKAAPVVTKVNAVTTETLETRGAEVQAVIEALTLASRDFAADPAIWVDRMVVARPDMARADLENLAEAYRQSWSVNGGLQQAELQATTEWMYQGEDFTGLRPVALEEWTDFAPLGAVLAKIGPATGMDTPSQ
ncbi:MAG: ABC transporter substrate-binding protein [Cereibacter changlensis]